MNNTETRVIVVPSEYDQILDQLAEAPCPRCLGTQTIPAMSDNGPDAHEVEVCCDHCDGDGTGRGAYKALAAFYGKARGELTQLRYYHWHTKQTIEKHASALEAAQTAAYAEGRKDEAEEKAAAVEALEYLFLSIVTNADSDYRARALSRAELALAKAMPGWSSPVPSVVLAQHAG